MQNVIKYMGKLFYVFNHANTLSNGMPIYGQTVQYIIWSKCAANNYGQVWSVQTIVNLYYGHLTMYITSNNVWALCDVN